jgi:hypothetical protein
MESASPIDEGRCLACGVSADLLISVPTHPVLGPLQVPPALLCAGRSITTDELVELVPAVFDAVERIKGIWGPGPRLELWDVNGEVLLVVALEPCRLTAFIKDAVALTTSKTVGLVPC